MRPTRAAGPVAPTTAARRAASRVYALTAVAVLIGACASDGSDALSDEDRAASEILPGATPGPTSLGEAGPVLTIRVRVGGGAELSIARTLVTTG